MKTLLAIGLAAALPSCLQSGHACTDIGCLDQATLHVAQNIDPATFVNATITVCQNEHCATGILPASAGVGTSISGQGINADIVFETGNTQTDLTVWATPATFARGDSYTVEIIPPGSSVATTSKSWIATDYTEFEPNGDGCGPICHTAQLQPE